METNMAKKLTILFIKANKLNHNSITIKRMRQMGTLESLDHLRN